MREGKITTWENKFLFTSFSLLLAGSWFCYAFYPHFVAMTVWYIGSLIFISLPVPLTRVCFYSSILVGVGCERERALMK
jgi:hypothetical protein